MKKFIIFIVLISIIFESTAGRLGSNSKSYGSKSSSTRSYNTTNNNSNATRSNSSNYNNTQSSGSGIGGILAGTALGALGGYLLGSSLSPSESSESGSYQKDGTVQSRYNFPLITIFILIGLLIGGLLFFRKKQKTVRKHDTMNEYYEQRAQKAAEKQKKHDKQQEKLSDGIEIEYFLRQARGIFLHIQSINTGAHLEEIAMYLTEDLYLELKESIIANTSIPKFENLDVSFIKSSNDDFFHYASIKFDGKSSEEKPETEPTEVKELKENDKDKKLLSPNKTTVTDFAEIWHFKKSIDKSRWLVAGIEQV